MDKIYVEPEFKVVKANTDDILTTSGEGESHSLKKVGGWEAGPLGGVPIIGV